MGNKKRTSQQSKDKGESVRRAVVNVGSGRYRNGSIRLGESLKQFGACDFMSWTDPLPADWPKHEDKQYSFKAWALSEAAKEHDLLIWADSAVIAIRSMEPLWEKIERDGYCFCINGWRNYDWCCDNSYADLFPGIPIEEAREINKTFTQVVATAFGLNLKSEIGSHFLEEYYRLSNTDAFKGPWSNTRNPNHWKQDPSRMGDCGPEDVLGHRHDQSAASVLAWRLNMTLTQCPAIFAFPPAHESTILLSVGA